MAQLDFIRSVDFDYSIKTGVTFLADVLIKDTNGVPMNLNGYAVKIYILNYLKKIGVIVGTMATPTDGTVHFEMSATDTEAMAIGMYTYQLEYSIGGIVTRISEGKIEVRD